MWTLTLMSESTNIRLCNLLQVAAVRVFSISASSALKINNYKSSWWNRTWLLRCFLAGAELELHLSPVPKRPRSILVGDLLSSTCVCQIIHHFADEHEIELSVKQGGHWFLSEEVRNQMMKEGCVNYSPSSRVLTAEIYSAQRGENKNRKSAGN